MKNSHKKWYKPWTWFEESGYYRTIYEECEFVEMSEIAQKLLKNPQDSLKVNGENAKKHAMEQSKKIAEMFRAEFARLDTLLREKIAERKKYANDRQGALAQLELAKQHHQWLVDITRDVESILDI